MQHSLSAALLSALLFCTAAGARETPGSGGGHSIVSPNFRYSYGRGYFSGDLTESANRPVHDFQISFLNVRSPESRLHGFLSIDILSTSAVHSGTQFPFPQGSDLDVLAFLFIPHLCSSHLEPVDLCFGIGQGTFNVNAKQDRRDFGTWNYQLLAELPISENATIHALGKYIGQVEQTVGGVYSRFGMYSVAFGLGWDWL
jgi:hypothetical protein